MKGYRILTSKNGLIGLKQEETSVTISKNGKLLKKIQVKNTMIPFGLLDDTSIYCTESGNNVIKIYRITKEGHISTKEIPYHSPLIIDDSSIRKYFKVNSKGDVVILDANKERCKVSIVRFE